MTDVLLNNNNKKKNINICWFMSLFRDFIPFYVHKLVLYSLFFRLLFMHMLMNVCVYFLVGL